MGLSPPIGIQHSTNVPLEVVVITVGADPSYGSPVLLPMGGERAVLSYC